MRPFSLAVLVMATATVLAQSDHVAKKVYSSSQNSVFLVYVNDSSGVPKALGSAFLVAPRTLITNAHVVEGGNPVLAVDPVRIRLRIVRTDSSNDLALLAYTTAASLALSLKLEDRYGIFKRLMLELDKVRIEILPVDERQEAPYAWTVGGHDLGPKHSHPRGVTMNDYYYC